MYVLIFLVSQWMKSGAPQVMRGGEAVCCGYKMMIGYWWCYHVVELHIVCSGVM